MVRAAMTKDLRPEVESVLVGLFWRVWRRGTKWGAMGGLRRSQDQTGDRVDRSNDPENIKF